MERRVLEVCVDSVESAVNAQAGGADRLEVCGDLIVGGVTPSPALYSCIRERVDLPLHVLIRPRFGDFFYSEDEFEVLRRQAETFQKAGADALVMGCLKRDGCLDLDRMKELMEIAGDTPVTLHRAFDMCGDQEEALAAAKALGIRTILTSGGKASAREGMNELKKLAEQAGGTEILAGAGIDAEAIRFLRAHTNLTSFHMSGKEIRQSGMEYRRPGVHMGLPGLSEYEIWRTDAEKVRAAKAALWEKTIFRT